MSDYKMVRENLFIYMTHIVVKLEMYKLKLVIYVEIGYLST